MQNQLEVNVNPDLQRKKQAIHLALCTVLSQEEAAGAANSWLQNVSSSASVFNGLNLFARNVCETYGKSGRHGELVQAMSRALMRLDVEEFAIDTESQPQPERVAPKMMVAAEAPIDLSGPEIITPEFASFQQVLLAMLHDLTQRNAELATACREFLLSVVENLPWSPAQQEQVSNLINNGSTVQVRPYRAGQLMTLMHHLMVWLKDILGEELASAIAAGAVARVERSPAGLAYSPRGFFAG